MRLYSIYRRKRRGVQRKKECTTRGRVLLSVRRLLRSNTVQMHKNEILLCNIIKCSVCFLDLINNDQNLNGNNKAIRVMANGDKRDVDFQDGGCFSRFLK